jgi:hypothetical protein
MGFLCLQSPETFSKNVGIPRSARDKKEKAETRKHKKGAIAGALFVDEGGLTVN